MATIQSIKSVSELPGAKITMNTQNGLYFLDTHKSVETSKYKCELNNYSFLSIVYDTKKYFSQKEIKERDTS